MVQLRIAFQKCAVLHLGFKILELRRYISLKAMSIPLLLIVDGLMLLLSVTVILSFLDTVISNEIASLPSAGFRMVNYLFSLLPKS